MRKHAGSKQKNISDNEVKHRSVTTRPSMKLRLLIGLVAFILLLAGCWYVLVYAESADVSYKRSDIVLQSNYEELSSYQAGQKFEADTGLSANNLEKRLVSRYRYRDFKTSYAAAQALQATENYQKALQAYELADSQATGTQASYIFYSRYSDAAQSADKKSQSLKLLDKAIGSAKNDQSLSRDRKDREVARLEQIKRLRKLGY